MDYKEEADRRTKELELTYKVQKTLTAEVERLRAALKEALDFIESDGCGGNVLVQRLRPLTNNGS